MNILVIKQLSLSLSLSLFKLAKTIYIYIGCKGFEGWMVRVSERYSISIFLLNIFNELRDLLIFFINKVSLPFLLNSSIDIIFVDHQ
jgi:hypothetical protein